MTLNKQKSRLSRWCGRYFNFTLIVLCALPLLRQVSTFYRHHPDYAINWKTDKSRRHPLSHENENVTEADLLNKCCIWVDNRWEHVYGSYASVYGGWDFKTSNRSHPDSLNLATFKGPAPAIRASQDENMSRWTETASAHAAVQLGFNRPLPPIMYVPVQYHNHPAHCIQDIIFSMLPMAYRGELQGVTRIELDRADNHTGSYCEQVVNALGWFERYWRVPNYTCFEKLWVPAFMHNRFPSKVRQGSNEVTLNSNGYLHKEDLSVDMLIYLQQQLWNGFEIYHDDDRKRKQIILIESRIGLGRRVWKEAHSFGEMLQSNYNREVKIVDDWKIFSLKEQAAIFHSASVFIGPHSGSNANLIFMRKGSYVLEIHCTGGSWARDWLLDLGIHHIPVLPDNPPCSNHNEMEMSVKNITILEHLLRILNSNEDKTQLLRLAR